MIDIDKKLSAKVGMSYLKVKLKVNNDGVPYLKAFNQLGEATIGVWVNPKVDLKNLFKGKKVNSTYSILGFYKVGMDKENNDKDFILINYISKVYDDKTNDTIPF
jgi:hypothetical protein